MFYFCHLKKLVRPETFGPYYVCSCKYVLLYVVSVLFVSICYILIIQLTFLILFFSCLVSLFSILCIFMFFIVLYTFSALVYSCLFALFVQVYRPLPPSGNQIAVNKYLIISYHFFISRVIGARKY